MTREIELTALSVAVTAVFGLLFSSLDVSSARVEASIPQWDTTEIAVMAPDAGVYGRDVGAVHLTRPDLSQPVADVIGAMPDCGALEDGRFAITPPVLQPHGSLELGEIGLVRPRIEMPELRGPLPALMDLRRPGPILRIA